MPAYEEAMYVLTQQKKTLSNCTLVCTSGSELDEGKRVTLTGLTVTYSASGNINNGFVKFDDVPGRNKYRVDLYNGDIVLSSKNVILGSGEYVEVAISKLNNINFAELSGGISNTILNGYANSFDSSIDSIISVYGGNNTYGTTRISTMNPIDITNIRSISARLRHSSTDNGSHDARRSTFGICATVYKNDTAYTKYIDEGFDQRTITEKTLTLDVSDLTGNYYIGFWATMGWPSYVHTLRINEISIEMK